MEIAELQRQFSADNDKMMLKLSIFLLAMAVHHYSYHGSAPLPDSGVTPGKVDVTLTKERLCSPKFHTKSVRNVPFSTKKMVCASYGQNKCPGRKFEIDHLIAIEIGGSNDISNLWPQPVDTKNVIGYHTKDIVENKARRSVCQGHISLADAQKGMASDWFKFGCDNGFIQKECK